LDEAQLARKEGSRFIRDLGERLVNGVFRRIIAPPTFRQNHA
jgi:hypothetical protein